MQMAKIVICSAVILFQSTSNERFLNCAKLICRREFCSSITVNHFRFLVILFNFFHRKFWTPQISSTRFFPEISTFPFSPSRANPNLWPLRKNNFETGEAMLRNICANVILVRYRLNITDLWKRHNITNSTDNDCTETKKILHLYTSKKRSNVSSFDISNEKYWFSSGKSSQSQHVITARKRQVRAWSTLFWSESRNLSE